MNQNLMKYAEMNPGEVWNSESRNGVEREVLIVAALGGRVIAFPIYDGEACKELDVTILSDRHVCLGTLISLPKDALTGFCDKISDSKKEDLLGLMRCIFGGNQVYDSDRINKSVSPQENAREEVDRREIERLKAENAILKEMYQNALIENLSKNGR